MTLPLAASCEHVGRAAGDTGGATPYHFSCSLLFNDVPMNPTPLHRPIEVLLVVDDAADAALLEKALTSPARRLTAAVGASAALSLLSAAGTPRPDLILLVPDPVADGMLAVLAAVKSDPHKRLVPVVVVLADSVAAEVVQSYQRQANCCLRRPTDSAEFVQLLGEIESFWLKLALLPPAD